VEGTHTGAVCEELQPLGRIHIGEDSSAVSCERDLMLELGQSVRSPPLEEEGETETTCDELTVTPIPHSPAPHGGREEGEKRE